MPNLHQVSTKSPTFSVVTVTFNDCERLLGTLTKTLQQAYKNFEIIVIDGGSKDNTLSVLEELSAKHENIKFISESDHGIYDAMNKGIQLANGKYTCFLNAGDTFYDSGVLSSVASLIRECDADVVYGSTHYQYPCGFSKIEKPYPREQFWRGHFFCHQSSFTKTSILRERGFDVSLKIAADFSLIYSLHIDNYNFCKIPDIVATFAVDGVSDKKRRPMILETFATIRKYHIKPSWYLYYGVMMIKAPLLGALKQKLPDQLVKFLLTQKQKVTDAAGVLCVKSETPTK